MRSMLTALVCAVFSLSAAPAQADVASASATTFVIEARGAVTASPDQAWRALTRIERWWNSAHTHSSDARNLSLQARAGGCWCERWDANTVEHARVVMVFENQGVRTLRVEGGLGPLQEMAVAGVLTFTLTPNGAGTTVAWTYRVSGDSSLGLDRLAPLVDGVIMEQFGRYTRLATTGAPQ